MPKMREHKLRSGVKWQGGGGDNKKNKIKRYKTRAGCVFTLFTL